jgi:hypothetical protein
LIVVADVSGKGMPDALLAASVQTWVRTLMDPAVPEDDVTALTA